MILLFLWKNRKKSAERISIPPLPPSDCRSVKFGLRSQKQDSLPSKHITAGMIPTVMDTQDDTARKFEEAKKRKEEHRKRYNEEIIKTNELLNQADDYEIACKIRAMVATEGQKGTADAQWIAWAKAKADWFDSAVAAKVVYFGSRNHKRSTEQKTLRQIESSI